MQNSGAYRSAYAYWKNILQHDIAPAITSVFSFIN